MIRANIGTTAALQTFFLINCGFAVHNGNGFNRAYAAAWVGEASLAIIRHLITGGLTCIASKWDHIDQREFKYPLC